jgi:predicted nucleic acid-binding protein
MPNQRLILDTTYVLPLFKIQIDLSKDILIQIREMWKNGIENFDLILPTTCLIEAAFKLNSLYRQNQDSNALNQLSRYLPTILNNQWIKLFHPETNITASEMAMKIRIAGHTDLMDCWIAGSAYALNGIWITEDRKILPILKNVLDYNINRVWNWEQLQSKIHNIKDE